MFFGAHTPLRPGKCESYRRVVARAAAAPKSNFNPLYRFKGVMWIRLLIVRTMVALVSFAIGVFSVSTLQYWSSFNDLKLEPISNEEYAREISVCDLGEPSGNLSGNGSR
jgi:hypothetical protein